MPAPILGAHQVARGDVCDLAGDVADDQGQVGGVNAAPALVAGDDRIGSQREALAFEPARVIDPDGEITAYHWDFGDGATSSEAAPSHVYRRPGTYQVKLTVTDDSGTRSESRFDQLVTTVNAAPLADAGADRIAAPEQTLSFDASGSVDTDGELARYRWNFGDGARRQEY